MRSIPSACQSVRLSLLVSTPPPTPFPPKGAQDQIVFSSVSVHFVILCDNKENLSCNQRLVKFT